MRMRKAVDRNGLYIRPETADRLQNMETAVCHTGRYPHYRLRSDAKDKLAKSSQVNFTVTEREIRYRA